MEATSEGNDEEIRKNEKLNLRKYINVIHIYFGIYFQATHRMFSDKFNMR